MIEFNSRCSGKRKGTDMSLLTERNYGPKAGIGQHRMPTTAPPVSIPASAQL